MMWDSETSKVPYCEADTWNVVINKKQQNRPC